MAILTLNDKQYDIEKLSPEAQAKLNSARFCEQKIETLEAELSMIRTARSAYLQALPELVSDAALVAPVAKAAPAKKASVAKKSPVAKKAPAVKKAPVAKKAPVRKTASKAKTAE
ncbi:DUF6447 family protein [Marinomonas sp. 15G1-11]|uniref:DUF6447 family protein n=1 Tax=Marinomonas phaeophyticola TaxID=3004091 RepID=A0ABT4JT23_9GAMM|nr:DUF6447 family protein [Marinomonas sp. 15G1-11]MCZ2720963.1 DUF6447 family protein [Marinomonas sp. 15G1-11]